MAERVWIVQRWMWGSGDGLPIIVGGVYASTEAFEAHARAVWNYRYYAIENLELPGVDTRRVWSVYTIGDRRLVASYQADVYEVVPAAAEVTR